MWTQLGKRAAQVWLFVAFLSKKLVQFKDKWSHHTNYRGYFCHYCIVFCIVSFFSFLVSIFLLLIWIWSFNIKFEVTKYGLICSPPTTCCQYPVAINGDSLGVLRHLRQIGTLQLLYTFHIYSQTTSTIHIVLSYTHSIRLLSLLLEQNAKIGPVYEMCCCCLLTWLEHYTNNFVSNSRVSKH